MVDNYQRQGAGDDIGTSVEHVKNAEGVASTSAGHTRHTGHSATVSPRRRAEKAEKRRSSRACLECRLAKTKCQVSDNQDVCQRCAKFSFDCRFVRHHRGRKPVSKLASLDPDELQQVSSGGPGPERFSDDELLSDADSISPEEPAQEADIPQASHREARPSGSSADPASNLGSDPIASTSAVTVDEARGRKSRDVASGHSKLRPGGRRTSSLNELDTHARRRIWEMLAQKIPQRGSTYTFVSKGEVAHDNLQSSTTTTTTASGAQNVGDNNAAGNSGSHGEVGGRPAVSVPSTSSASAGPATTGSASSSSQNFLSTFRNLLRPVDKRNSIRAGHDGVDTGASARYPRLPDTLNLLGPKDPIDLGLVSLAAARQLYDYFFNHINQWAMIFDPHLVSHDTLRASSSHLYTTILFLASRYIELTDDSDDDHELGHDSFYRTGYASISAANPDRITSATSARLGSHARSLAITAFALGDRRTETGVAMYLASVWKEADDHFTVLYCSYAAKIMSDVPTELLALHPSSDSSEAATSKTPHASDPAANSRPQRLRRHQQRQFLFHFIQEHTQLLHFAPRPNFDRGPSLLRNLLAWSDDALATEDDVLLCADIDSVLLQTKYKSIMEKAQTQEKDTLYGGSECFLLLQSFLDELEGWRSRWEWQARKINQRFGRDSNLSPQSESRRVADGKTHQNLKPMSFEKSLPLGARMNLLSIMRSSLVMQISSIAFRASLRDINKAKPSAAESSRSRAKSGSKGTSNNDTTSNGNGAASSSNSATPASSSLSMLSAMDDRAEQIYYICLDSALNLLVHTIQMPASILRHAQDMIMVLAPHAALLATYLISLPLPSVPHFASIGAGEASERFSSEFGKVKTRIRRRKEYERKCLELMRDTRESFKQAVVRSDDHVGLCALYFDSLLNVIEGESGESRVQTNASNDGAPAATAAGVKRSRSSVDTHRGDDRYLGRAAPHTRSQLSQVQQESTESVRSSSVGPGTGMPVQRNTSTIDSVAAETLLNLHSENQPFGAPVPSTPLYQTSSDGLSIGSNPTAPPASRMFGGGNTFYPQHHVSSGHGHGHSHGPGQGTSSPGAPGQGFSPLAYTGTSMFGNFAASPTGFGFGQPGTNTPPNMAEFSQLTGNHTGASGSSGTGTSTPVDWTWLQSFLDVPEFSWM
ncbi:hypothetical protein BCV70DRAFT_202054 [Testicularia cyperi]|uniref:Zn(2)-C6 fungal-type domain-containing protein n=1 Tax=Testicularia cyperi TaxID=1882483 RepID=A0A317XJ05_9BASI|nr:hypothetical protein BCV70DRAFT_202054 [Testicularia cyperi]